jgi:hypothetical protein
VSVKVNLPPGCYGFEAKDGTKYTAKRPGGHVDVDDRHARAINQGQYGQSDFISAKGAQSFGTKTGQLCESCGRVWNAWNSHCQKCDVPTVRV